MVQNWDGKTFIFVWPCVLQVTSKHRIPLKTIIKFLSHHWFLLLCKHWAMNVKINWSLFCLFVDSWVSSIFSAEFGRHCGNRLIYLLNCLETKQVFSATLYTEKKTIHFFPLLYECISLGAAYFLKSWKSGKFSSLLSAHTHSLVNWICKYK